MQQMKLLDLYCGAGGAAMGYSRAGFTKIVGVDIEPQPRYPFEFVHNDAIEYLKAHGHEFDAIHASPPCQKFSLARLIHGVGDHKDWLTPTREAFQEMGFTNWVIENVPGSPMKPHYILCGSQFGTPQLRRHRLFEFGFTPELILLSPCAHHIKTISVFGHGGHIYHGVEEWKKVMGIDWMTRDELSQAIPPAYTEFIGKLLIEELKRINAKG